MENIENMKSWNAKISALSNSHSLLRKQHKLQENMVIAIARARTGK
jgi:hypothetical protein